MADQHPDLWKKKTESGHAKVRPTAKAVYLIRACNPEEKVPWWEPIEAVDAGGNPLPVQRFDERLGWRRGSENGLNDSQLGLALDL
ncbi:hypothetical protein [Haloquadratum walsbyi]|uniref:hypothetical protein n=1 Tax=Haloquadratum walsbyi TaxID=293091 RepID=UPI00064ED783|nr:hypothetical protein [Haloquadratum walsbyi]